MDVSMMITCLCDALFPDVGTSAVRVLENLGVRVRFPAEQTCCGQPAFNSGYWDDARKAARAMIRAFRDAPYVVSVSGSCAGMIRHHYPMLFDAPELRAAATDLASRTYEFTEFLVKVLRVESLPARMYAKAAFHNSCHTRRWLGVDEEPLRVLSMVEGLEVVPIPDAETCCGFGGTFSVKMPELSGAMVDRKAEAVLATEAELLVSCDASCLMNIAGRLARRGAAIRCVHVAELLAQAWRDDDVRAVAGL
ncbi:MAG: (Fe-S)-binding protein [Candidatus Dadabacteria bacterium]|nr:MAG: (Fe-S)-binding protein [Candidatus Dadabacteria bacterium]